MQPTVLLLLLGAALVEYTIVLLRFMIMHVRTACATDTIFGLHTMVAISLVVHWVN